MISSLRSRLRRASWRATATPHAPISGLNRVCNLELFEDPVTVRYIRRIFPVAASTRPYYPKGEEHRKAWEFGHAIRGLHQLGVIRPDAWALSIAGGHEEPAYYLTNHIRWVFLVDIYGGGAFTAHESEPSVLVDPDRYAPFPYNRRRLVVEYMNALDLRFEDETFDAILCLSSIEHFGGVEAARRSLEEMRRVLKPGGVAAIATECIIDGSDDYLSPTLCLFSPTTLDGILGSVRGLEPVGPIDYTATAETLERPYETAQAVADAQRGIAVHPHVAMREAGRVFTSLAVFLRKTG